MAALVMAFSLFFAGVVQAAPWMLTAKPPALLAVVLYYALTRDRCLTLTAAIIAGFVQDALGMSPIGSSSVCFGLTGLLVNHFHGLLFTLRTVTHVVIGAITAGLASLVLGVLLLGGGHLPLDSSIFASRVLVAMALGAVTVPVIFRFVDFLDARLDTYGRALT